MLQIRFRKSPLPVLILLALLLGALNIPAPVLAAPPQPDLGPNVIVFDPSMPVADIQAHVDAIYTQQVNDEMGTNRYALLFKPGVYGTAAQPLQMKVGYYTEVAGLGASPTDVTIVGKVEVYNRCLADGGTSNCLALVNFWRTLSNLTINVNALGQDGCRASADFWAVSQAVSMRRVNITGANLSLMDYCTAGPQYASGGFIADSNLPFVINGSQQQWLIRNSVIGGLVQRRLEPGLRRRRRRACRRDLPRPALYHPRHHAHQPREAISVPRCARQLQRPCAVGADQHPRYHVGCRDDTGRYHPA